MYSDIFEQLNNILDEDYLIEMANVRGKDCKVEDINFSFYFSPEQGNHTIRAKIEWNRDRIQNPDGTILLFGDYKYIESNNCKKHASQKDINAARDFFKRWKVLFAAVWTNHLDPVDLRNFFEGRISFISLCGCFYEIKANDFELLKKCNNVDNLYEIIKNRKIFNLYEGLLYE